MTPKIYTTAEVATVTDFSTRQLDYWAQQGIVVPSIQQSHGPGTRRLYSFEDLVQLRFIRRLKNQGWSTQKIRQAIVKLRDVMDHPDPLKRALLIHSKRTILAICKTKEGERILLDTLDPTGQQVMWILLETLQQEVSDMISTQVGLEEFVIAEEIEKQVT
jgi:DNA-binding transcriptional MerR regulator